MKLLLSFGNLADYLQCGKPFKVLDSSFSAGYIREISGWHLWSGIASAENREIVGRLIRVKQSVAHGSTRGKSLATHVFIFVKWRGKHNESELNNNYRRHHKGKPLLITNSLISEKFLRAKCHYAPLEVRYVMTAAFGRYEEISDRPLSAVMRAKGLIRI